ncbi:GL16661 [Drosophila persimilis]|uniref:GL16661 n=1 Tax=Drosophila persimilis TaxID=7234 RepID=B4HD39_DROPE|nr:GL16661 [Drosophila persimilis]
METRRPGRGRMESRKRKKVAQESRRRKEVAQESRRRKEVAQASRKRKEVVQASRKSKLSQRKDTKRLEGFAEVPLPAKSFRFCNCNIYELPLPPLPPLLLPQNGIRIVRNSFWGKASKLQLKLFLPLEGLLNCETHTHTHRERERERSTPRVQDADKLSVWRNDGKL